MSARPRSLRMSSTVWHCWAEVSLAMSTMWSNRSASDSSSRVALKAATTVGGSFWMNPTVSVMSTCFLLGRVRTAGGGVKGSEQLVLDQYVSVAQCVEQGAFPGVGIAYDSHNRDAFEAATVSIERSMLPHCLQVLFETLYLALDDAAVAFQLCLAGASGADAAAQTLQVRPASGQAGQEIFLLSKLDLKSAFVGLGTLGEDIEDECRAVYYLDVKGFFQVALLRWGELIIEDDEVVAKLVFKRNKLLEFAFSHEVGMIRGSQALGK